MSKRVSNSRTNRFKPGKLRARQSTRWGWVARRRQALLFEIKRRQLMAQAGVVEGPA